MGLTLTLFSVVVEWGRNRFSLRSQLGDRVCWSQCPAHCEQFAPFEITAIDGDYAKLDLFERFFEGKATEVSFVVDKPASVDEESFEVATPKPIHITHGYSRDHRPDLKQFIIDLICSGDGDVPLYLRVADGAEIS